ncbi:serine/threonine-protein kinase PLK1-like [Tubulanus polymorphus]|uniref:serine/threonine-protein kinase PLK1-like n=1 Tax=Tubulanus polymorphus TaxID=672921 RepID=UPI003DA3EBFC
MATRREDLRAKEIAEIIVDEKAKKRYQRGKFLGKGGFAKCYELTDMETKKIFAGKIVSKSLLTKQHQKEKMAQEISIHRQVCHKHIVGFHGHFEDAENIYILLELCPRRSMMELHKRRKAVTEPETRYFVKQMLLACCYLHRNKIIHRDLKLGNLFLNENLEVKIGDFGLATRVDFLGERKKTLCGTPNYIAPEVLGKKGHSYEVDVWSLGCILYTLLVGKPPFETSCLKDTYTRIKRNEYHVPSRVSLVAKNLIQKMLRSEPGERPSVRDILQDEFFTSGYMPAALPTSCLTVAPRFDSLMKSHPSSGALARKPLHELNTRGGTDGCCAPLVNGDIAKIPGPTDGEKLEAAVKRENDEPDDYHLNELYTLVSKVVASKPSERAKIFEEDAEDPAGVPIYWVDKWVDYSDKYGLGYQLSDNSVGVLFNDSTRLLLTTNGENIQYIERDLTEHLHTLKVFPETLMKKVTLLKYFRNYMSEHLLKAGGNMQPRDGDDLARLPFLRTWFRTRSAIILHLSNGTLQINFFQDHTKIILCPLMGAISYIDEKRDFRTFRLALIDKFGCSKELASRLRYAKAMIERLVTSLTKSGTGGGTGTSAASSAAQRVKAT